MSQLISDRYAMSTSQVARRLGLSANYVICLARAGRIPYRNSTLGRLYDVEAVERLAQERGVQPPQLAA